MSQDKQERREFIPFEVVRKADTDLSEGEEVVLIEGREGIRFFSEEGKLIHSTEPVTEMRIYGPKSRIVDFETIRTPNADLEPGEERTIQEGYTGIELVDDEGNVISSSDTANTKIEYGPEREEIPFTMVRKANDDLEPGEERVTTLGKVGMQLVDEEGNITPLKRPISGELEYGPERIEIPFDEVRKADSDLDQGAEEIIIQGEVGIDIQTEDGERTRIKEPVTQEINYGPERVALPFESKRTSNPDLDEGIENILVAGEEGLDIVDEDGNTTHVSDPVTEEVEYGPKRITLNHETIYKVNFDLDEDTEEVVTEGQDGLELKDEEGSLNRISEPVTEVVEYGPTHVQVDFDTVRRSNPDLDEGQEQVIVEGEYGIDYVDRDENTTRQKEPQTQEIEYGPQKITIDFKTDYQPNKTIEPFEEKVVNQGQTGLDIIDESYKRERITEPVTEVIEYGPERERLPYETIRTSNHEIAEGEETVLVEGQEGTKYRDRHGEIIETVDPVTEEIEYGPIRIVLPYETKRVPSNILYPGTEEIKVRGVDGLDVKDEEGNVQRITEPVTEVVEYGQERITVPYKIDRVPNVKLAPGKEKIITPGKEGYRLRDEEGYESDGINSVTQVVEYGPHKETVPFGYVRHVNKDLAQGEERLIADGRDGLQFVDDEGNVLKSADPVDAVVEYGPATRVIPYTEERQLNEDLSPGEELVISEGIDGIEMVDEEGNVVSRFNPYPRIIAYGE